MRLRRDLALARRLRAGPLVASSAPPPTARPPVGTNIGTWKVVPVGALAIGSTGYARPPGITEVEM